MKLLDRPIERLRKQPDGMLLSRLVHAEIDGRHLDMRELMSIIQQLLVAGNETTTSTLAGGVKLLIDNPGLVRQLRAEPALIRNFVEETLRVMTPIQTMFRRAIEDIEIHGVTIPKDAIIEPRFGAANRDPAAFAEPACPDLHRVNAHTHLAFGAGPHLCIGNQLARSELRLAFKALLDRIDHFRPSRGEASYAYTPLYIAYGLTTLWMSFDKR
jgi:cytochrome P450